MDGQIIYKTRESLSLKQLDLHQILTTAAYLNALPNKPGPSSLNKTQVVSLRSIFNNTELEKTPSCHEKDMHTLSVVIHVF